MLHEDQVLINQAMESALEQKQWGNPLYRVQVLGQRASQPTKQAALQKLAYIIQDSKPIQQTAPEVEKERPDPIDWNDFQVFFTTSAGKVRRVPLSLESSGRLLTSIIDKSRKIYATTYTSVVRGLKNERADNSFSQQTMRQIATALAKKSAAKYVKSFFRKLDGLEEGIRQDTVDNSTKITRRSVLFSLRDKLSYFLDEVTPSPKEPPEGKYLGFNRWFTGENRDLVTETKGVYLEGKIIIEDGIHGSTHALNNDEDEFQDLNKVTNPDQDPDTIINRSPQVLWSDSGPYMNSIMQDRAEDLLQQVNEADSVNWLKGLIGAAKFQSFCRTSHMAGNVWQIPGKNPAQSTDAMCALLSRIKLAQAFLQFEPGAKLTWNGKTYTNPSREAVTAKLEKLQQTWNYTTKNFTLPPGITFRNYAQIVNLASKKAMELEHPEFVWTEPTDEEEAKKFAQEISDLLGKPFTFIFSKTRWGNEKSDVVTSEDDIPEDDALRHANGSFQKAQNVASDDYIWDGPEWEPDEETQAEARVRAYIRRKEIDKAYENLQYQNTFNGTQSFVWKTLPLEKPLYKEYIIVVNQLPVEVRVKQ